SVTFFCSLGVVESLKPRCRPSRRCRGFFAFCVCRTKMPLLSITSVTPASGPTGGSLLVEISGAGFQLPEPPDTSGPTTPPPPTVRVLVAGRPARDVRVIAAGRLTCVIPTADPGPADIIVQNLDASGAPIPGEVLIG